jgi:hypothetical protein
MKMKIEVIWKIEETLNIEIEPEEYNQIVRDCDGNKNLIALALDSFDKKRNNLNWRLIWGRSGKERKWRRISHCEKHKQLQGMKILEE